MDFSRWGLDKINRISDRYRDFTEFLTDVLEGDRSLLGVDGDTDRESTEPAFQTRDDISMMLDPKRLVRLRASERVGIIFRALAPYFDAGFLLRPAIADSVDSVSLESMFIFGRVFQPAVGEAPRVALSLPDLSRNRVVRGRIGPVLQVFRLDGLETLKEASVFAFSPAPDAVFILVCNRPHPWQVDVIERAVTTVTDYLRPIGRGREP